MSASVSIRRFKIVVIGAGGVGNAAHFFLNMCFAIFNNRYFFILGKSAITVRFANDSFVEKVSLSLNDFAPFPFIFLNRVFLAV